MPTRRVMGIGVRATELVDHLEVILDRDRPPVEERILIESAVRRAFRGRSVVGAVKDDGVVELRLADIEVDRSP